MQLQYLYGNPRRPTSIAKKVKRSAPKRSKNPVIVSANPLSKKEVAKINKEFAKLSKGSVKKTVKTAKKAVKKSAKKSKSSSIDSYATKLLNAVKNASKKQGEATMAVKKKAKKLVRKVAKKRTAKKSTSKKVAKKIAKKSKVAKKIKVAKKAKRKVTAKKKTVRKASKRRSKKVLKAVGGTIRRKGKTFRRRSTGAGKFHGAAVTLGAHQRSSNNSRRLKKGQKLVEVVQYAPKRRKNKKGKIVLGKTKVVKVTAVALNPKRKKRKAKRSNPIIMSNPRRSKKRRNPIVMSNPRFMKNPIGSVGSKIVNLENKILGNSGFKTVDGYAKKFLNAGVLEVAGLTVGAAFDGKIVSAFDWLFAKVPMIGEQVAKIPAKYKSAVLVGTTGLALHALNTVMAKKSGRKSQILDELSKGLIASTLVKLIAGMSPMSVENHSSAGAVAGYRFSPAMSGSGMGAFVRSNPSASLPVPSADFSGMGGADFEGSDYGTSSIGGADFEGFGGIVTSMGSDIENAVDADDMFSNDDYGSDVASINGIDF